MDVKLIARGQCNQSIEAAVIGRVDLDGSTAVFSFTDSNQDNKQNYQFEINNPSKLPCHCIADCIAYFPDRQCVSREMPEGAETVEFLCLVMQARTAEKSSSLLLNNITTIKDIK